MVIQNGCLGALHGEQSLTVLNRCGMLVFNKNIIWNVIKVMISTSKRSTMEFSPLSNLLLCTKTHRGEQGVFVYPMLMILHTKQDMVICFTNISEVCKSSERHPMGEGFHFSTILYVHNCLENMLKNLD